MRPISILLLALCATVVLASVQTDLVARWQQFKVQYEKSYPDFAEETKRFNIFQDNIQRVERMNAEHGEPFPFGTTMFMDLTPKEFKAKYLMKNLPQDMPVAPVHPLSTEVPAPISENRQDSDYFLFQTSIPTEWDWGINKTGIITPVKNQGQCGSCWAFSATEEIESMWALKHSEVVLAPQQIVDCDKVDQGT